MYEQRMKVLYPDPSTDLFRRLLEHNIIKLGIIAEDPVSARFAINAFLNPPEELKNELQDVYDKAYKEYRPSIIRENIDFGKFRKGIDPEKAIQMLMIFFEGMSSQVFKYLKDRESIKLDEKEALLEEAREYVDLLKYGIYEREDQ